jgi:class 3 adenylate cyclase/tetratricopeptide (TPR) repeat protein
MSREGRIERSAHQRNGRALVTIRAYATDVQREGSGTATVLYTDVVGSTEMRVRLGDVEADLLRRRHDATLRAAVERHGGTVIKGLGDGIMAAFGASVEAVGSALEIQRDIDRMNRQARDDSRIGVRVGISVGDVSWEDGDCHGTPVVTAARICGAASGGQILCDDLVRGLARGHIEFTFQLVGELDLKGLGEPVLAYEVPWATAAHAALPLPAAIRQQAGELPFAGRVAEREQLTDAWKRAQVERATTVLLAGEPGIGKTRIASELVRQAHGEGAVAVLGRCEDHVAAPYAPWTEALRSLVTGLREDVLLGHIERHGGEVARLVADLTRRVPGAPPPATTDADTERLLLFEAVVDLLQAGASDQPLIVLLDDAHWADAGSLHLLRHVVGHVDPDTHLLVLVTYRDTDIDRSHPLAGALADLYRATGTERISLRGLDESGVRAFLEAAGGHPLTAEGEVLAHRLAEETEGNPFFVTEVLRHLVETGMIVQRDGQWVGTTDAGTTGLPEGVRDVVGQRLTRHSQETNDMLRVAAVIGRQFSIDLVAGVAEVDEAVAGDALDEAVAARLIEEVERSPGQLVFSHALVRQTLLDELTTNKRLRLHRRIAELLDDRRATPIEVLAHHYLEAAVTGVAPRAIECACAAATSAISRMAWEDALVLYERALEVVDLVGVDDEPLTRSDILAAMADAQHGMGDAELAHRSALAAAALARQGRDAARLCKAGIAYQGELGIWATPSDPVGVDLMREGLANLDQDADGARARTLGALAQAILLVPGGALDEADEALAAAREAGDDMALMRALQTRAWAVRGVLPVADRLQAAEAAVQQSVRQGDRYYELVSRYLLANAHLNAGDLTAAAESFGHAAEFRGGLEGWAIADFRAALAVAQGHLAESIELADEAARLGLALGDTNEGVHAMQRWTVALLQGDLDGLKRWHERCAQTAIGLTIPTGALSSLACDGPGAARAELDAWVRDIKPLVPDIMRYSAVHYLSRLAFELDTTDGFEEMVDYADRFEGELLGADAGFIGSADAARGRYAAVAGDLGRAVELLEAGHAFHVRLDLQQLIVESGVDLGTVLLRRAGPGDEVRACELLGQAEELADRIGMVPWAARARALTSAAPPARVGDGAEGS